MKITINIPEEWLDNGALEYVAEHEFTNENPKRVMTCALGLAILKACIEQGRNDFQFSPEDVKTDEKATELFFGTVLNCTGLIAQGDINKTKKELEEDPIPPLSDYNNPDSYTSYPV